MLTDNFFITLPRSFTTITLVRFADRMPTYNRRPVTRSINVESLFRTRVLLEKSAVPF